MSRPVVHQAASLLLGYPGRTWTDRLHTVRTALEPVPGPEVGHLLRFCAEVADTAPLALAAQYVATFDRSGRRCLYLTYYTDGDTRRRGASLARIKSLYREQSWLVPEDELPDHLPLMLEFAARSPEAGVPLLCEYRPALELLRYALEAHHSPYTGVVEAVCRTLPGPRPAGRDAALGLARTGPPVELVGLQPYPPHTPHPPHGEEPTR
ncbi:nitrate reductase molybdenum cofactor assembly chaperone [Streptomyces sp. NPDC059070]|uniref:nitrate reductase molybdenum cofactor assembly chaperone n=1 Tax=unclassified Streptomyces TaxID=2593676 RepID=UPI0034E21AC1